jgi:hypothetical protein
MTRVLKAEYGLTTAEALRAFSEGHPEMLPASNRWKHFVVDHANGTHEGRTGQFARVCVVCKMTRPADPDRR